MDYWNRCRSSRMAYWQSWGQFVIVWVVWLRHGGMVVARVGAILLEMTVDFTVALGTIVAFKCLARVTESVLHLHL